MPQSDGGLAPVDAFSGHRAILSGPAGGYVGYALTTRWEADGESDDSAGNGTSSADVNASVSGGSDGNSGSDNHVAGDGGAKQMQMIGFDMGGTSTDVSRYAGTFEHVFETTTAGVTIQAPQLDVNTVAAGGGSRLFYRAGAWYRCTMVFLEYGFFEY